MKKLFISFIATAILIPASAQKIAPLWKDFVEAKRSGKVAVLPDFSYAGYKWSEKSIPSLDRKKKFNVVDFGARPDDDRFDDAAIQAAVDAAEKDPDGGVVFFPAGKYLIAPDTLKKESIRISKSNIVLKGSGSGKGGTEIFQANMRVGARQIIYQPKENSTSKLATVIRDAGRETFWLEVADASGLKIGQDVTLRHKSEEYTRGYFAPLELKQQWTRLFGEKGGMNISEIHTIEKIEGNRIKFVNPVHLDVKMVTSGTWDLYSFHSIEECGIEDILFTSNWKAYPEDFIHHKNAIHDNAYEAVGMEYVKNSWIRNCEFHDWNEAVMMRAGYQVTVLNTHFRGKKGHTSVHARSGYGVLIKNCSFNNAQHHGRDLVLWNYHHKSEKDREYNFWDMSRRRNYTIALPVLVGFRSDNKVRFENAGIIQMQGEKVLPESLFEAQLALRLTGKDITKNETAKK